MRSTQHTSRLMLALLCGLLVALIFRAEPALAQSNDPYTVIELVNQVRAEYGLAPYRIDPALMAAAQAHSEWAASLDSHSHTGAGGSTPKDRALAAGYGGGADARVSENIYWGGQATAISAVTWWRGSQIHFQQMTSTQYIDIGAGVAYSNIAGYYTLNFGVVAGTAPPASSGSGPATSSSAPPALPVEPIEKAEANEDGSIIHEVGEGHTLWGIADTYDVPLSEILALNYLSEDAIIHSGDRIIIVPAAIQANTEPEGPLYHTVEAGHTLFGIAISYGLDLDTLLNQNGLSEDSLLHPGDQILIRPAETTPTPEGVTPAPTQASNEPVLPANTQVAQVVILPSVTPQPEVSFGPPQDSRGLQVSDTLLLVGGLALVAVGGLSLVVRGLRTRVEPEEDDASSTGETGDEEDDDEDFLDDEYLTP